MHAPKVDRWLLLAIGVLTIAGALLLSREPCRNLSERDVEYFGDYVAWQSAFDALSATCGVGLLATSWDDYTETGRWTLVGLGALGSLLYLALVMPILRGMGATLTIWSTPSTRMVLSFLTVLVALTAGVTAALVGSTTDGDPLAGARLGIVTALSLGLVPADTVAPHALPLAGFAWLIALGWPVWFFVVPALSRRHLQARQSLAVAATYTILLVGMAGTTYLFEQPRGGFALRPGPEEAADPSAGLRSHLATTTLTATAGLSAQDIETADLSDGSKFILVLGLLLGPAQHGVAGGLTWVMLLFALAGALFGLRTRNNASPHLSLWCGSALAAAFFLVLLTSIGALGLLLIEGLTGSRFAHPPSLVDALLDAAAAVGGGNLTSGLTARVTAENLVSGKNLPGNAYMYGMSWIMLLMLLGRVVPLLILRRLAEKVTPEWNTPES